jgi:hypothetical protein
MRGIVNTLSAKICKIVVKAGMRYPDTAALLRRIEGDGGDGRDGG